MKRKKYLWLLPLLAVIIALAIWFMAQPNEGQKAFLAKADLLKSEVVTDDTINAIDDEPVDSVGYVIFFSVSDSSSRAKVYKGTGNSLSDAWDNAVKRTVKGIKGDSVEPKWLRGDVVNKSWPATALDILNELRDTPSGFDYHGLSFDPEFEIAFPEGWLNGSGLYDYK